MNRREYQEVMFNSELPYPQRLLYAYLRSCVDYKTGIAGDADNKRISYQGIREALEFRRPPGSRTRPESYSNDRIFKLLIALERGGFIVSMESEVAAWNRRPTIRKYLPLAVTGQIRPNEEGDRRATQEGDSNSLLNHADTEQEGYTRFAEEGDTSVISFSLSHNSKYIYYEPDDSDRAWVRYTVGPRADEQMARRGIDLQIETETFNLRHSRDPNYDMGAQRQDWRVWIIRALQHKRVV